MSARVQGRWRAAAKLVVLALCATLNACQREVEDMHQQPKYEPGRPAPLFPDNLPQRTPPAHTLAHAQGPLAGSSSGRLGQDAVRQQAQADQAQSFPHPVTPSLLALGQTRYGIYCVPCHSPIGDGDGWVVRRGFPAPPSYHTDRLRQASDRHLYEVISHGQGMMYGYGDRLSPEERWAVVAFVRALQLSQHAAEPAPAAPAASSPRRAPA